MTDVMMTDARIAFGMYANDGIKNPKANKARTPVIQKINVVEDNQYLPLRYNSI